MDPYEMSTLANTNFSTANATLIPTSPMTNVSGTEFYDDVTDLMTTMMMTTSMTSTKAPPLTLTERLFLLTMEQRKQAEDIMVYIRYVIYAVSLPLTTFNVAVFLQPSMRGATSVYIIVISLAQLLYIVTNMIGRIMMSTLENRLNYFGYLVYSVYVLSYSSIVLLRASYVTLCYVCLERLYAVLRPFHIKRFVLTRHPIAFSAATYVFSAILHTYTVVKSSIIQVKSSKTGKMVYVFRRTEMYEKHPEAYDVLGSVSPILMVYLPLFALLVMNLLTIWALRRHNVTTQRVQSVTMSEEKRLRERQMTVTIMATTVCYVVLSLPYACHTLLKNSLSEYDKRAKYENIYIVMRSVGFTLTLLSFAVDFICFFFLSTSYRKTFLALIRVSALTGGNSKKPTSEVESGPTLASDVETKY